MAWKKGQKHTEEAKRKISEARTEYYKNPENRKAQSRRQKQYYNDHPEACAAISDRRTGQKATEATRVILSNCRKKYYEDHPEAMEKFSKNHPMKKPENAMKTSTGLKRYYEDHPEIIIKKSEFMKNRHKNYPELNPMKIPEVAAKISAAKKKWHSEHPGIFVGSNNPCWRGGTSFEPYCPKWNRDLQERIRAFFNYECIICGKPQSENGRALNCHHVEYNKQACCDGEPVHFAALCNSCHTRTNFNRDAWTYILHRIIDELYAGCSYFTKEEWKEIIAT